LGGGPDGAKTRSKFETELGSRDYSGPRIFADGASGGKGRQESTKKRGGANERLCTTLMGGGKSIRTSRKKQKLNLLGEERKVRSPATV